MESYEAQKARMEAWNNYFASYPGIKFLNREEFELAMQPYLDRGINLGEEWWLEGNMVQVRERVQEAPEFSPLDAGDAPGPFEMWYGTIQSFPFVMLSHYHVPADAAVLICRSIDVPGAKEIVEKTLKQFLSATPTF